MRWGGRQGCWCDRAAGVTDYNGWLPEHSSSSEYERSRYRYSGRYLIVFLAEMVYKGQHGTLEEAGAQPE